MFIAFIIIIAIISIVLALLSLRDLNKKPDVEEIKKKLHKERVVFRA